MWVERVVVPADVAGMCVVEECPYRHVNVNPKAAVCQGFLRGYCAQGDKVPNPRLPPWPCVYTHVWV